MYMIWINLYKIITQLILPPGLIVLLLLLSSYYFYRKNLKTPAIVNLFFAMVLYLLFIEPFQDFLYRQLEDGLVLQANPKGDVIVVLGGGIYENSPDLNGNSVPSDEALARIVMAFRLYKTLNIPIITTGGKLTDTDITEAGLAKKFLLEMGVSENKIIEETESRTTAENAKYVAAILKKYNYKKPILVTTAYHMKRAVLNFRRFGVDVITSPCSFRAINKQHYKLFNYVPGPANPFPPLKELLGIACLKWFPFIC